MSTLLAEDQIPHFEQPVLLDLCHLANAPKRQTFPHQVRSVFYWKKSLQKKTRNHSQSWDRPRTFSSLIQRFESVHLLNNRTTYLLTFSIQGSKLFARFYGYKRSCWVAAKDFVLCNCNRRLLHLSSRFERANIPFLFIFVHARPYFLQASNS